MDSVITYMEKAAKGLRKIEDDEQNEIRSYDPLRRSPKSIADNYNVSEVDFVRIPSILVDIGR